jgi:hypothetical protein
MAFYTEKNTFLHLENTKASLLRRTSTIPASMMMSFAELEIEVKPKSVGIHRLSTASTASAFDGQSFRPSFCSSIADSDSEDGESVQYENQVAMTTVMIRNIPCRYSQRNLSDEVAEVCDNFDFLYMPPARTNGGSKGYAFVNFRDAESAAIFVEQFQCHSFDKHAHSWKKAEVDFAEVQGLEKNMRFYKRCKAMKLKFQPYVCKEVLRAMKKSKPVA